VFRYFKNTIMMGNTPRPCWQYYLRPYNYAVRCGVSAGSCCML